MCLNHLETTPYWAPVCGNIVFHEQLLVLKKLGTSVLVPSLLLLWITALHMLSKFPQTLIHLLTYFTMKIKVIRKQL